MQTKICTQLIKAPGSVLLTDVQICHQKMVFPIKPSSKFEIWPDACPSILESKCFLQTCLSWESPKGACLKHSIFIPSLRIQKSLCGKRGSAWHVVIAHKYLLDEWMPLPCLSLCPSLKWGYSYPPSLIFKVCLCVEPLCVSAQALLGCEELFTHWSDPSW